MAETTTIILTLIFVALLIIVLKIGDVEGKMTVILIIAIILTPIFGLWIMPNFRDEKIKIEKITPSEVVKTSTTAYIEFDEYMNMQFTEKKDYDNIDTNTVFYIYRYYDNDGDINSSNLYRELKDDNDSIYIGKEIMLIDE